MATMRRLPQAFFARAAPTVARELVGTRLVHEVDGERRVATVVETEAYCGPEDAACHARFGRTKAREDLFGEPGRAYVFLVYGMHLCFNVVCLREGSGHAVLVRAVEPLSGLVGRGDGPGRVTRALGLSREHGGVDLVASPTLFFAEPVVESPRKIGVSARVGVGYAGSDARRPWRFFDASSASVSRPPASQIGLGLSKSGRP